MRVRVRVCVNKRSFFVRGKCTFVGIVPAETSSIPYCAVLLSYSSTIDIFQNNSDEIHHERNKEISDGFVELLDFDKSLIVCACVCVHVRVRVRVRVHVRVRLRVLMLFLCMCLCRAGFTRANEAHAC